MQWLAKGKARLTKHFVVLALELYFSFPFLRKGICLSFFRLLARVNPYPAGMSSLLLDTAGSGSGLLHALDELAGRLPYRRRKQYIRFFAGTIYEGKLKRRSTEMSAGVRVPPLLIVSLTSSCNLNCKGCYAKRFEKEGGPPAGMEFGRVCGIIEAAGEIGIHSFILVGGEPFLYPGLLDIPEKFPDSSFFIFTNGTLVSDAEVDRLSRCANVFPVLSVETDETLMRENRCIASPEQIAKLEEKLTEHRILYGKSVIVHAGNYSKLMEPEDRDVLFTEMCKAVMLIKYSGPDPGLSMDRDDMQRFNRAIGLTRWQNRGFLLNFPEDEYAYYGGCPKGKALLHILPDCTVEYCPFDTERIGNLSEQDLLQILRASVCGTAEGARCNGCFQ